MKWPVYGIFSTLALWIHDGFSLKGHDSQKDKKNVLLSTEYRSVRSDYFFYMYVYSSLKSTYLIPYFTEVHGQPTE